MFPEEIQKDLKKYAEEEEPTLNLVGKSSKKTDESKNQNNSQ